MGIPTQTLLHTITLSLLGSYIVDEKR